MGRDMTSNLHPCARHCGWKKKTYIFLLRIYSKHLHVIAVCGFKKHKFSINRFSIWRENRKQRCAVDQVTTVFPIKSRVCSTAALVARRRNTDCSQNSPSTKVFAYTLVREEKNERNKSRTTISCHVVFPRKTFFGDKCGARVVVA